MNFLVTQEQKLGTSSHQALPEHSPVMQEKICLYGDGGYSIGAAFEHFDSFVPILGILTSNFAPNCSFLKCRKGYVIGFEQVSSPKGGEFDHAKKIHMPHLCPQPSPSLSVQRLTPT